jgi:signal transduction histidine kinase
MDPFSMHLLTVALQHERDVVLVRQRARQVAECLAFDVQEQTRIATAVSEIACNTLSYAGSGKVEFSIAGQSAPQALLIHISDHGPGMPMLQSITDPGILSARRLMDQCDIQTSAGGTTVTLKKLFPKHAPVVTAKRLAQIAEALMQQRPQSLLAEVQQQNQELLRMLEALRKKQEDLLQLNRELEDTNRGVVALYGALDETAEHLRRANEMKSRFLFHMSHEFRVPLSTIVFLSRLLLDRTDGGLTGEQEKQVSFICKAAESLSELVNDLLDLAKIEAGKITVRPAECDVATLFSTLRGMLRPLLRHDAVDLIFEAPVGLPPLVTDESKVSQILRNFISNALKFTERGEVRVSAALLPDERAVRLAVADTGIGIAPEDQERIFEEFTQLENPLQKSVLGTGLGLPLCKKLATLLGGRVAVDSALGVGSTFSVVIPLHYQPSVEAATESEAPLPLNRARLLDTLTLLLAKEPPETLLIVHSDETARNLLKHSLTGTPYAICEAATGQEGLRLVREHRPQVVFLDLWLPDLSGFAVLEQCQADPETREILMIVYTAQPLDQQVHQQLATRGVMSLAKDAVSRQKVLSMLELVRQVGPGHRHRQSQ